MDYTAESQQDAVIESVLLTTEKTFIPSKPVDHSETSQNSEAVYFQIED